MFAPAHICHVSVVALHPQRRVVNVLATVQWAGHFAPLLPCLISAKACVVNDFPNSRSLPEVDSGLHSLVSEARKTTRGKSHAKLFDLSELHLICRYTALR